MKKKEKKKNGTKFIDPNFIYAYHGLYVVTLRTRDINYFQKYLRRRRHYQFRYTANNKHHCRKRLVIVG